MSASNSPKLLCVDDEPAVLEGLMLVLHRRFDVTTAGSGEAGLEVLKSDPGIATIISDMRMPGMNGAAFLAKARELAPDATRLLLTGQSDMNSAISAVNEGQIFRFLTKPCPAPALVEAVNAAVAQHRLVTAERVLLEQTLHGSIHALTEVLSLTSPAAFGRATRLKQHVSAITAQLAIQERWQVELAAMLSQLGCVTLPQETVEALYHGRPLSDAQRKMVDRVPLVTEQLLASIPRLEQVRAILAMQGKQVPGAPETHDPLVVRGAAILRAARDFDQFCVKGNSPRTAISEMRSHAYQFDADILDALTALHAQDAAATEIREVRVRDLKVGMVLAEDLVLKNGALFVARGYTVTPSFVERVQNLPSGTIVEPVRAILPDQGAAAQAA